METSRQYAFSIDYQRENIVFSASIDALPRKWLCILNGILYGNLCSKKFGSDALESERPESTGYFRLRNMKEDEEGFEAGTGRSHLRAEQGKPEREVRD